MREILFRGKRLDNGEWVEGWYQPETTIKHWNGIQETVGVTIAYKVEDGFLEDTLVDPSTVGQYTGLTDKNGKRIFEGDIIQYYERQLDGKDTPVCDVVAYTEGGFAVKSYFLNNWLWDSVHGNIQLWDVEVIGNIHDNPELLKGGEG